MAITWPAGVRKKTLKPGYKPSGARNLIETQMERGHKLRRVATGTPEIHKCRLRLPTSELDLLETWLKDTNPAGAQLFTFPHPRTGIDHECQFVPKDGAAIDPNIAPGENWFVDFEIRIYPN